MPFKSIEQFFYLKNQEPSAFKRFMSHERGRTEKEIIKRLRKKGGKKK